MLGCKEVEGGCLMDVGSCEEVERGFIVEERSCVVEG